MKILRWIFHIAVVFFLVSVIFKVGSNLINSVLIAAGVVFILDSFFLRKNST